MAALAILVIALTAITPDDAELRRFEYTETHMGMPYKLVFYAADETTANRAAEAAYARVKQLDETLSDYKDDSELSKLNDTAPSEKPIPLGDDLWAVLQYSQGVAKQSDGAFDVTVGPLVSLWRRTKREKSLPTPERLAAARAASGHAGLLLNEADHTARLTKRDMRLNLGGVGCGYACDEALKVLRERGITRAMIDASGDVLVGDAPPDKPGWRIGIANLDDEHGKPSRFVILANHAITTSGDAFQFVEVDGVRYGHIVDPRTGLGLTEHCSATVIAPRCIDADAWTKPVCILGPNKAFPLIDGVPGAAAMLIRKVDGKLETRQSSRWQEFVFEGADGKPLASGDPKKPIEK